MTSIRAHPSVSHPIIAALGWVVPSLLVLLLAVGAVSALLAGIASRWRGLGWVCHNHLGPALTLAAGHRTPSMQGSRLRVSAPREENRGFKRSRR
jgi:hypothetical protein